MILGLAMVYNEIDFIKMWLDNMSRIVDRIIIMDGGSTDGTVEAINEFKADIPISVIINKQKGENYNDPEYNHQVRRNILISLASGLDCYIFQMDVDESICDDNPDVLRDLVKSGKKVYTFPRYDFCWNTDTYKFARKGKQPWLYKNGIGIKYSDKNPPHEPLEYKGQNICLIDDREDTDILIYHWHYCWGRKAIRDYFVEPANWEEFQRRCKLPEVVNDVSLKKWEGDFPRVYQKYIKGRVPNSAR
jgi:glycosyltransferase involved in cell wall biosynthesis